MNLVLDWLAKNWYAVPVCIAELAILVGYLFLRRGWLSEADVQKKKEALRATNQLFAMLAIVAFVAIYGWPFLPKGT